VEIEVAASLYFILISWVCFAVSWKRRISSSFLGAENNLQFILISLQ
jgi:hypothetical protein